MQRKPAKTLCDSIRFTMAYYAGNVALSLPCPKRLKENLAFLHDYIRRGYGRDALGCMVENIFMGDPNDRRYAAVIRWYERHHPGTAGLIVACLDDLAEGAGGSSHTVKRIRHRLRMRKSKGTDRHPQQRLKRIVGR